MKAYHKIQAIIAFYDGYHKMYRGPAVAWVGGRGATCRVSGRINPEHHPSNQNIKAPRQEKCDGEHYAAALYLKCATAYRTKARYKLNTVNRFETLA